MDKPITRWVITLFNKNGMRGLAFANQGRNSYATKAEAEEAIKAYAPGLRRVFGGFVDSLEAREVEVYGPDNFDAKGVWFD